MEKFDGTTRTACGPEIVRTLCRPSALGDHVVLAIGYQSCPCLFFFKPQRVLFFRFFSNRAQFKLKHGSPPP